MGPFPGFIEKTDETRIQILDEILPKYNGTKFYATEKVDGCSITVFYRDGDFGICTRNLRMKETPNSAPWKIMKALGVPDNIKMFNKNLAIQGELIGWNIQSNKYKLKTNEFRFYLFNVFDINKYQPVSFDEMLEVANKLNLQTVPNIDPNYVLEFDIDSLVEKSKCKSLICPTTKREGLVFKSVDYIVDAVLGRLSFKVINPDFLIKYNE
jgi:RNA ligase (TIGR02306 family)